MEITEPIEEKPVELGITKADRDSITLKMGYILRAMDELCGLFVFSWKCRHLYWETEKRHEWHFILETESMKKAFSIYKEHLHEVTNDLWAMSLGLAFVVQFKSHSVTRGLESEAATKLLQMNDSCGGADRILYAQRIRGIK
jgi:hypothetical protein